VLSSRTPACRVSVDDFGPQASTEAVLREAGDDRHSLPISLVEAQLIAALWATINCCSASVTDRGGWCVAAPSNANRLAPLAMIVNGQNCEK
jgi:hypothetical protein